MKQYKILRNLIIIVKTEFIPYSQFETQNDRKINLSKNEPNLKETVSMIKKVRELNKRVRTTYNKGTDDRDKHHLISQDHMFHLIDKKLRYTEKF